MSQLKYDPKELLSVLVELDYKLQTLVNEQYPEDSQLNIDNGIEEALDDFLTKSNLLEDDIGYLTSQMALHQLGQEIKKAIEIVVETNNLQAHHDFNSFKLKKILAAKSNNTAANRSIFKPWLAAGFFTIVLVVYLFYQFLQQ